MAVSDPSLGPRTTIFRETGLVVVFVITLAYVGVVFLTPGSPVRVLLGFVELVFAPGYALGAVLFVRKPLVPVAAEFAIAVGLSVIFNVLVGLLLTLTGAGLAVSWLVIADTAAVSLGLIVKAVAGDLRGGSGISAAIRRELRLPGVRPEYRGAAYALLVACLLAFAGVVYLGVIHPAAAAPTSLALYGPGGTSASLPSQLVVGQVGAVVLAIGDGYSNGSISLAVTAIAQGENISNVTLTPVPWTVPLSLSNATTSSLPLALAYDQHTTLDLTFEFTDTGTFTLVFTLEAGGGALLQGATLSLLVAA